MAGKVQGRLLSVHRRLGRGGGAGGAIGLAWPAKQLEVVSPSEGAEPTPDTGATAVATGRPRRGFWGRLFGG